MISHSQLSVIVFLKAENVVQSYSAKLISQDFEADSFSTSLRQTFFKSCQSPFNLSWGRFPRETSHIHLLAKKGHGRSAFSFGVSH